MDLQSKGKKAGKARIPDHLRRRALVSCDRCKKRRIRCTRGNGADAHDACVSCLEVGAKCESTLPRKTRIYGSVETLSVRYRVLDTLIKGLFPSNDTNNIDELYSIAEDHGIALPVFNEQTVADEVFSNPPAKQISSSPREVSGDSNRSPSVPSRELPSLDDEETAKAKEEKLVPMPNGPSHYIGPSSSFGFVLTVRNMVAEFNAALRTIQPEDHLVDERSKISSEFAGSTWSKALDPINKEESDESSDGADRGQSSRQRNPQIQTRPPYLAGPVSTSVSAPARSKRATVLSMLPEKRVCDAFIHAYFENGHPNYLLFHRPTFLNRYQAMWEHPNLLMRDVEPGWICCVFMMMVFGAQALESENVPHSIQIQRHYLDLVQARMHQLVSATTLINVQALLLLQLYQHNCTERNSAFMLLGCAAIMAMALGMHREGTSGGFDKLEREVRKRVWWTTYSFEQYQCAILGRPCAIDDVEVNVTFPDEMVLDHGESVPQGYVEHSIRLAKLLSDVRRNIYASPSKPNDQNDTPKCPVAIQFLLDLDTWHHGLPPQLRLEFLSQNARHRRAVVLLHIQFHHVQSLVTRPFILRKVGVQLARQLGRHVRSQDLDNEEMRLSDACGTCSKKSAQLLQQLLSSGTFDGRAWMDAYYVYHSVFILSLDFLARPWNEKDTEEDLARKTAVRDVMSALENVKLCPTFTILTQVSLQLAKIVGIFDARSEQHEKAEEFRRYMEQQQATFTFDYNYQPPQTGNGNVINGWYARGPVDLPFELKDFFGADFDSGAVDNSFPITGVSMPGFQHAYVNNIPPVISEEEFIATAPPPSAYTHWGAIDTPFAQQQQQQHDRSASIHSPNAPMFPPGMSQAP
ncbi:Zn2/Cys6 DNA-binding protein [Glarea lozoyensis ATCC 20868]|uniref:Zn2/Cys6 DNA-binding protein n=1 Tax=Glarea lozoyensis (strain ATCC 20868 / MF5171) TaxID=1116229 RepID=S3CR77_GLAL2|nr:Zn2/Cys6 DNA-binding protein [Glarea lozoyensis ATCC 20868]EPE28175.1 Zn2/Cys6 DNA-binding protein [Glarea lozoyensis ATCC 20868]